MVKKFLTMFALVLVLVLLAGFVWQQYSAWQAKADMREAALAPQGKLPDTVSPEHYTLNLRIDPDKRRFSGEVSIDIRIHSLVDEIWLHGEDINASSARLIKSDGSELKLQYREMGNSGVVSLTASAPIAAQQAQLVIAFDAPFSQGLDGLYSVEDGGLNYAFTQFEAVGARKVFPQFDEPRFKVRYDVSLEVRSDHKGFGNTPIVSREVLPDEYQRLTLATTKPLPSYLLAFAVGDLDVVEYAPIPRTAIRGEPIPLRGIATKNKGERLGYALEHTAALLTTLEEYFGTPYPYAKLDLVAVPEFAAGAMENAGLITYRESLLLFDGEPSVSQQRRYANIHAHELAHQWFGNLVTMPWWDDIWLNESFATWMAAKTVHKWNPGFEMEREIVRSGHWVMGIDIYADTRRVREPVLGREEIANAFDYISYAKGGAILQMLESAVTPAVFREGIRNYLEKYAWGSATAENLLEALAEASVNSELEQIAQSFINQAGVPALAVDWHCKNNTLAISLAQERYLPVGSTLSGQQQWAIPVCLRLVGGDRESLCRTINGPQLAFEHTVSHCPTAVMPNHKGHGYYRWSLTPERWRNLLGQMSALSPAEKFSAANNLAAEFRAGNIDTNFYIEAASAAITQPEWDVRVEPSWQLREIRDTIANEAQQAALADYLYQQYKPTLDELGLEPDTAADTANPVAAQLLRKDTLNLLAVSLRQPDVLKMLSERGKALIGYPQGTGFAPQAIDRQLHATAMASAVIVEGLPYFEQLFQGVKESSDASFRRDAVWALGQTTEARLSEKILNVRQLSKMKLNEMQRLVESHARPAENRERIYAWFKRYYPFVALILPEKYLAGTPAIAGDLCSRAAYDDAEAFFTPHVKNVEGMQRVLSQNLEKIQLCYELAKAQRSEKWLIE